ncbi:hypothetical protein DWX41_08280 [Hungatella hathewayi]|uniref:Uncharacterized protein n=1 Tax=Hungatella hathewayi TaxID=154046 RepID=A0A3E2WYA9_9FIRM|nr:hypothetical protein DWX41_08280 [Hungatella hathewayi]
MVTDNLLGVFNLLGCVYARGAFCIFGRLSYLYLNYRSGIEKSGILMIQLLQMIGQTSMRRKRFINEEMKEKDYEILSIKMYLFYGNNREKN